MKLRTVSTAVGVALLMSTCAYAEQPTNCAPNLDPLNAAIKKFIGPNAPRGDDAIAEFSAALLRDDLMHRLYAEVETFRIDKQVGAEQDAKGTTTATSKPTVPGLLALAVENGALTRTDSGTTLTFATKPFEAVRTSIGLPYIRAAATSCDPLQNRLAGHLSLSVTFDTSRGATPGAFTGSAEQFSNLSLRYEFINRRDARNSERATALKPWYDANMFAGPNGPFPNDLALGQSLKTDALIHSWAEQTMSRLQQFQGLQCDTGGNPALCGELRRAIDEITGSDHTDALANKKDLLAARHENLREPFLNESTRGALLTGEFTLDAGGVVGDANRLTGRMIGEWSVVPAILDVTANASLTWFQNLPPGLLASASATPGAPVGPRTQLTSNLRDVSLNGEADITLGTLRHNLGTVALSGKMQRIRNAFHLDASGAAVVDEPGTVWVGQLKWTVRGSDGLVIAPVTIVVSNRSENLAQQSFVRGTFGVTLNLDAALAALKPH